MVCKIAFCSEFPDIPDNAGKVMRRRRRGTQAIVKRYAFHANVINFGDNTDDIRDDVNNNLVPQVMQ